MILVAIAALATAAPGEYKARVRLTTLKGIMECSEARIKMRSELRDFCLVNDGCTLYDAEARYEYLDQRGLRTVVPHGGSLKFDSWASEAVWHERSANNQRRRVELCARQVQKLRANLIIALY